MAYIEPSEFVTKMVDAGESKVFRLRGSSPQRTSGSRHTFRWTAARTSNSCLELRECGYVFTAGREPSG